MENTQQIQNIQNPQSNTQQESENTISIKDLVFLVINNWYWFALSLFVCLLVAGIIFKTKPKVYECKSTIMVRDDSKTRNPYMRNMDAIFNNMGDNFGTQSLDNEIYLLKSSPLAKNVVTQLNLNKMCDRKSFFTKISYYQDRPLDMKVLVRNTDFSDININVRVTPIDKNRYSYVVTTVNGGTSKNKGTAYYTDPITLNNFISFTIDKTSYFSSKDIGVTYDLSECPVMAKAYQIVRNLSVGRIDKNADILVITYSDNNDLRAKETINALVDAYNADGIKDKNLIAQKIEKVIIKNSELKPEMAEVDSF